MVDCYHGRATLQLNCPPTWLICQIECQHTHSHTLTHPRWNTGLINWCVALQSIRLNTNRIYNGRPIKVWPLKWIEYHRNLKPNSPPITPPRTGGHFDPNATIDWAHRYWNSFDVIFLNNGISPLSQLTNLSARWLWNVVE